MASVPYAAAAEPTTVFEEASSTIGKGKGRSLPVSRFTFEVPGPSKSTIAIATTPEQQTPQSTWGVSPQVDASDMAGSTTPKLKPRRVSTSALPAVAGLASNLAFRDEMGISQRATLPTASHPQAERSDSPGTASWRKGRPRKAMSMSSDPREPASSTDAPMDPAPKRARRNMWTEEETRHLVEGCKIHGVGNWKMILEDPRFKFQDRSPVDLKDRFRVSFPDAYRKHYPNAKTHLSHRTSSALPDGVPVFEKSLPKKRRPFTAEEDEALKRGYEKYGTVWASIAKDPIFATRRSTDLRDRFRNAFPDLYVKAGYKPRTAPKKIPSEPTTPAEGDSTNVPGTSATPSPRRLRRKSDGTGRIPRSKSLRTRVTKSTRSSEPSAPCSDAEDEDDEVVETSSPDESLSRRASDHDASMSAQQSSPPPALPTSAQSPSGNAFLSFSPAKTETSTPEQIPPFLGNSYSSEYSRSDYNASAAGFAISPRGREDRISASSISIPSSPPSVFGQRTIPTSPATRIGNSAWGPSSWLSSNPRLDSTGLGSRPASFLGIGWPIPEHGVFDRYDLYSGSNNAGAASAHEYASQAGDSKHHAHHLLDPLGATPGFTHHPYAGDLISAGAGLYSNQDLEYLSTTSGTTSHLDVGQLSLQSQDDNEDEADPFAMDEQPFAFNEDAFASLSVERPHTAEPASRDTYGQGLASVSSPLRRPSTAMSMSHTQLGPSTSNYYHVPRGPSAADRGVSAPTTTPASPFMTSQTLNFDPISTTLNLHSQMQRSRSSTSFGFPSAQPPAPPQPPSSFKQFTDPPFTQFTQHAPTSQSFGFASSSSASTTFPPMAPSHHVRSSSQPPREHRQYHTLNSTRPSTSIYDFLQLDDIASSSPVPSAAHAEPLSTAALDLHYGTHIGRLTPSYIRDNPNDPLVAHSAFMQGLELGLGIALQHTTSASGPQADFGAGGNRPLIEAIMASATGVAPPGSVEPRRTTSPSGPSRMTNMMSHTRGQSFTVSPRDLGLDNGPGGIKKRKRASWDGRPA